MARSPYRFLREELRGPSLCRALRPVQRDLYPETYLTAFSEAVTLILAFGWIVTLLFNWKVVWDNPLRTRLGYNDLCVGIDKPPARYIAVVLWGLPFFLGMKYCRLSLMRTYLVKARLSSVQLCFSWCTDVLLMISISAFSLVFVISPEDSVWGHSIPFIQLIFVFNLVIIANMLEHPEVGLPSWIFLGIYSLLSLALPLMVIVNYVYYDFAGEGPLTPWWLNAAIDYAWFCSFPLNSLFLPEAEHIEVEYKVTMFSLDGTDDSEEEDDEEDLEEAAGRSESEDSGEALCPAMLGKP